MGLISSIKSLECNTDLHVPTDDELKRIKIYLISLLDQISTLCKENDIAWFLTGGSMLGAIRHKGFIPWDDDVDINMFRVDFEKFVQVFKHNQELKNSYELLLPGDKDYYSSYPRIFCKKTIAIDIQHGGKGTGLWIDIFVLENISDNIMKRLIHGTKSSFYLFVISCCAVHKEKNDLIKYGDTNLKRIVAVRDMFSIFFSFKPIEKWIEKANKCFSAEKNAKSSKVVVPTGSLHYWGEIYDRNKFMELIEADFEGRKYPIPKDYDYYLKKRYGSNYMELPPESTREKHLYLKLEV